MVSAYPICDLTAYGTPERCAAGSAYNFHCQRIVLFFVDGFSRALGEQDGDCFKGLPVYDAGMAFRSEILLPFTMVNLLFVWQGFSRIFFLEKGVADISLVAQDIRNGRVLPF